MPRAREVRSYQILPSLTVALTDAEPTAILRMQHEVYQNLQEVFNNAVHSVAQYAPTPLFTHILFLFVFSQTLIRDDCSRPAGTFTSPARSRTAESYQSELQTRSPGTRLFARGFHEGRKIKPFPVHDHYGDCVATKQRDRSARGSRGRQQPEQRELRQASFQS